MVILVLLVLAGSVGAPFAFAQDASIDSATQVDVGVRPGALPKNPLKLIKEKAGQARDSIKIQKQEFKEGRKEFMQGAVDVKAGIKEERKDFWQGTVEARKAMHAEVKADLDAATTVEEKQSILKGARFERAAFRVQVKTDAMDMRAGFRAQRSDLRAEARDLIADRFTMIMNRLVNALERFDQILARIDSRIEKLETEGVDVSAAVAASASASLAVDAANTAVANAQAAIEAAAASETPREEMDEVRVAVRAAVDSVKAAHQAIKEALRVLKSLASSSDASASVEGTGSVDSSN